MMDWTWISHTAGEMLPFFLSALGMYVALIVFTRLSGLRSFSKISSFDFATTVAFGSVLASVVLSSKPPLLQAVGALGAIYLLQHVVSRLRLYSPVVSQVVDNTPILIMDGSTILHENLSKAGVTEADLRAKLREANVTRWDQVHAVVAESTGDVSVLHKPAGKAALDPSLLAGVRGVEQLDQPASPPVS